MGASIDKQTRVVINGEVTSSVPDYINASYVNVLFAGQVAKGIKKEWKNAFIATQAPLAATRPSFWEMISQQNSRVIFMLCKNTYDVAGFYI